MAGQGTPCQGRGCTCCSSDVSRPSHVLPLLEDTAWHLPRALRPPGMQGRGARVIAWLGHLAQSSEHASCPDGPSRAWLTATWVLHQSTTKSDGRYQIPRPRNPVRATQKIARLCSKERTREAHIPSDLVVERWASDVTGSSRLDFPFLHGVWPHDPASNNHSNINQLKIYH